MEAFRLVRARYDPLDAFDKLIRLLLKNGVFRQPVRGTGMCRHFQWLQAI